MQPPPAGGGMAAPEETEELQTPSEAIFATVDTDGSGAISFEEFARWWSHRAVATSSGDGAPQDLMENIRALWDQYDADKSGDLSEEEFAAVLASAATSDWKEAYDAQRGKTYYYHKVTKETRWRGPDQDKAVSELLVKNGISVELGSKQSWSQRMAAKARVTAAAARQKANDVSASASTRWQQSERAQRASAASQQWQASAEQWKLEAKAKHKEKLMAAGVCTVVLVILALIFGYMWWDYKPPPPPPPRRRRRRSTRRQVASASVGVSMG
eukprot:COSAG01_NODE_674_length_14337_cov_14.996418_7_plen_271_part_00